MTIEEFIESLGIPHDGEYVNGKYVIEYDNSDDFSDVFNMISLNKTLICDEHSVATDDHTQFTYTDGMFEVVLTADYKNDLYNITVEER